jgi:hypothetical protein
MLETLTPIHTYIHTVPKIILGAGKKETGRQIVNLAGKFAKPIVYLAGTQRFHCVFSENVCKKKQISESLSDFVQNTKNRFTMFETIRLTFK